MKWAFFIRLERLQRNLFQEGFRLLKFCSSSLSIFAKSLSACYDLLSQVHLGHWHSLTYPIFIRMRLVQLHVSTDSDFMSFIFFTLSCPSSLLLHSKAGFWHDFYQVQLIPRGALRTRGNAWLWLRRIQVAARLERCVDRYGGAQTSLLSPCVLRSQRSPACAQAPECSVTAVPQRAF